MIITATITARIINIVRAVVFCPPETVVLLLFVSITLSADTVSVSADAFADSAASVLSDAFASADTAASVPSVPSVP